MIEGMRSRLLGAVIAGGRASRFGSDKAEALLNGLSLIGHAIQGLRVQCHEVVICGRIVPGYQCLLDRPQADLGPLGGLGAALHYAHTHGFDAVLTSACDIPIVPTDLANRLCGSGPAMIGGQPLLGYWPASLTDKLDRFLARSANRSMARWADACGARLVWIEASIPNINTVRDLAELRIARRAAA